MKLSLQLKLGQTLTMTPQLQQAIRLLQLSTLDLQQEIHQALESNPMLELDEGTDDFHAKEDAGTEQNSESNISSDEYSADRILNNESYEQSQREERLDQDDNRWEEHIPEELSVDSSWEDVYQSSYTSTGSGSGNGSDGETSDFESRNSATETLQDHLMWQLNLTPMSDADRLIGLAIVDAIDSNGMLTVSIDSIHASLIRSLDIDPEEVVAVLHRIQQFDPVGVGYRNLSECLLIQLNQVEAEDMTPAVAHAKVIVKDHLPLLGNRDYAQLMRITRLKEPELRDAISIIESLNPRPGADISPPSTTYIVPDVIVSKDSDTGRWRVELNPETAPRIRINPDYASLVRRSDTSSDNNYLRDNLQEARWFIKSLQSRNETLMKVATRIVEHQKGFFEYGEEAMKPLVLHDIAEAVNMHESTISRVTTQKYMHTPKGIFELKYFFSSHVSTAGGGECSSTAIRALIKKLVAGESARKPLSDSKITKLLEDQGINVARRTIAKYRESLSIPPSNERKKLV
ncbi:MAG: RNA polymerase factor sigma-54 [Gammaproteobacteria bacterium RIFCSPLOWO2_02_FULL_57_10]|nr:MAG: RNA polymerase factor sigma-54 [Gammaproteobacteria bacterium RIFCSPLOWO2_02_FULL_57_10]